MTMFSKANNETLSVVYISYSSLKLDMAELKVSFIEFYKWHIIVGYNKRERTIQLTNAVALFIGCARVIKKGVE